MSNAEIERWSVRLWKDRLPIVWIALASLAGAMALRWVLAVGSEGHDFDSPFWAKVYYLLFFAVPLAFYTAILLSLAALASVVIALVARRRVRISDLIVTAIVVGVAAKFFVAPFFGR